MASPTGAPDGLDLIATYTAWLRGAHGLRASLPFTIYWVSKGVTFGSSRQGYEYPWYGCERAVLLEQEASC